MAYFVLLRKIFIYFVVAGLSCSSWDLHYIMWDLSLGPVGSVALRHVEF